MKGGNVFKRFLKYIIKLDYYCSVGKNYIATEIRLMLFLPILLNFTVLC